MRLPRVRVTVRRVVVAVVLVALPLGLIAAVQYREARFRRLAAYHLQCQDVLYDELGYYECNSFQREDETLEEALDRVHAARGPEVHRAFRASLYHSRLYEKYVRAAASPWRPVAPDPPPPPRANPRLVPDGDCDRVIRDMVEFEGHARSSI